MSLPFTESRALPCSSCKKCAGPRRGTSNHPLAGDLDGDPLRYVLASPSSAEILDLTAFAVIKLGHENYALILNRAMAAERLFEIADEKDQLRKVHEVQGVLTSSQQLLELFHSLNPKPSSLLDGMFDFDKDRKYLSRWPPILKHSGKVA